MTKQPTRRDGRRWIRWAVVSNTGLCIRSLNGAAAIYSRHETAIEDAGKNQYVAQVEIRELRTPAKRRG